MDTVDSDIYEMQDRKSKMNAAIMESAPSTKPPNQDKKERKELLQAVVNRFVNNHHTTTTE